MKAIWLLDLTSKAFIANKNKVVGIGGRINEMVINFSNKFKNNKSRNLTYMANIKATRKPIFLTSNAKSAFNYL